MPEILKVDKLSKAYGNKTLFEDISFIINEKEKIALIAKNGTGKTSLLNILTGKDIADAGNFSLLNNITIGFLEQEPKFEEKGNVIEQVLNSSDKVAVAVKNYENAIKTNDADLIQKAADEIDRLDAWDFEREVKIVLTKLKLTEFDKPVELLSGGQKKRLALAVAILNKPDFLILDEPTNHLDFEMIEWLEDYIAKSSLTLLLVTHDRYFLDRVCNVILELEDGNVYKYSGNYEFFLKKRNDRIENTAAEIDKAKSRLRTETKWMNRQPQARATKAKSRIDNFYKLKEKAEKKIDDKSFDIEIEGKRLGKKLIDIYNISKKFDDLILIDDFSYKFSKGEKIAIFGNNGIGKSTLLNLITDKIPVDSGKIEKGATVSIGYFEQKAIDTTEDIRLIDYIKSIAEIVSLGKNREMTAAQFAEYFLFPRSMHYNYISQLRGGEKRRLYLLSILMRNPNFLILDEPTNDLDIMTLAVLEDYLLKFTGTVLFVSHDRFFIDAAADMLFVFEGNGKIKKFPGNYSDYSHYVSEKNKKSEIETSLVIKKDKVKKKNPQKLTYKEKKEFEELEKELEILNSEKEEIETYLQSGNYAADELNEKSQKLPELIAIIDKKEMRWLELSEKI
ncbi:MAG: ABC-F family ATP-binding cassette domain-containing protein [Bacteroidales bacterium]|nr:ABC-F family ATP-binding cassette domain-containing protein [Bacteroidales bacterium]